MRRMFEVFRPFCAVGFVLAAAVRAAGEPLEFNFKDPKGVNTIVFTLDSVIEPIVGVTSGISGTLKFDPKKPDSFGGKLVVESKTLRTENKNMNEHLHGADWMNVETYPEISLEVKKVESAKQVKENTFELQVVGDLTCRGVTKSIKVPVKLHYLPGMMGNRLRGQSGDLLVVRSEFVVKRKEHGIKPSVGPDVVAEDVQLRVAIVGACPKPAS